MIGDWAGWSAAGKGNDSRRALEKLLSQERAGPWMLKVVVRTDGGPAVLSSVTFFLNKSVLPFGEH